MTINNRLTKLEEQTAELIIEAQELRKKISKTEDVKQSPMVDKFGRYLSEPVMDATAYIVDEQDALVFNYMVGNAYYDRILALGDVFNTRENAELQILRNQLTQRARVFMHKDQAEGELDWADERQCKYCVHLYGKKLLNSEFYEHHLFLAFTSPTARDQFRKEFSDNEILMILEVE
jgi:hypothetical protein